MIRVHDDLVVEMEMSMLVKIVIEPLIVLAVYVIADMLVVDEYVFQTVRQMVSVISFVRQDLILIVSMIVVLRVVV